MVRLGKRTLGFSVLLLLLFLGLGVVYALKPGNCPPIKEYGPYDQAYDTALILSGGPVPKPKNLDDPAFTDTRIRIQEATDLHKRGIFPDIVLTGTPEDVSLMVSYLEEAGVSYELPEYNSFNTTGDMLAGFSKISKDRKVAIIAGEEQIARSRLVARKYNLDPENNDGYFPVDDTYTGEWFGVPRLREYGACLATRFGLEKFKGKLPLVK